MVRALSVDFYPFLQLWVSYGLHSQKRHISATLLLCPCPFEALERKNEVAPDTDLGFVL